MIDTHTHLYLREEFGDESPETVRRALASGVRTLIFPNVDESTMEPMLALHHLFPSETRIAAGLHPTEVNGRWRAAMEKTLSLLDEEGCVAVGEIGIDLYWDKTYRAEQMQCLEAQLKVAGERSLPVIIHCREGLDEVLEVFQRLEGGLPTVIFHSFTMDSSSVRRIREMVDAYFGINGVVTFKNASELREALPEIGIDRIILETDSPYLAPVPHRGRRNESSYLGAVRDKIAEVLSMSPEEVERTTDRNASEVFGLH